MTVYLTGGCSENNLEDFRRHGIGLMLTPAIHRKKIYGLPWAADTGCFRHPDSFDLGYYLQRLEAWRADSGAPLFVTAPDVLADPAETWARAAPILPQLRAAGYVAALVSQDGMTDPPWDEFDCLFVGGTTGWKLSEDAYRLVGEAKSRGKWTHMGRVSSRKRFLAAKAAGYDSADGTFVGFGPDIRLREVADWLERGEAQLSLWEST